MAGLCHVNYELQYSMEILQQTARSAIVKHGSVTAAARALRVNQGLLSQLANGQRKSASPKTLRRLGLVRQLVSAEPRA